MKYAKLLIRRSFTLLIFILCIPVINTNIDTLAKKKTETKKNYVVKLKSDSNIINWKATFKDNNSLIIKHIENDDVYLEKSNCFTISLTTNELSELRRNKDIEIIEEDMTLFSLSLPNQEVLDNMEFTDPAEEFIPRDPILDDAKKNEVLPWNIKLVAGNPILNEYKGAGVKIAFIDSGISMHHDLNTKGWVDFSDYVHGYKPIDSSGHGTKGAGIINARVSGFGIVGIAPDAQVYSIKIINQNDKCSLSGVIKAIEWCIANEIDVINMGFGMDSYSKILEDVINKAYEHNIVMVAAAGNSTNNIRYPAKYINVISVGAIDRQLNLADFSARGDELDLVAPGVDVYTTGIVGSYEIYSGTSISAAHVTGIAAVLKGIDISKSVDFLRDLMNVSAIKVNSTVKNNDYGNGIVSLENAVRFYDFYTNNNISTDNEYNSTLEEEYLLYTNHVNQMNSEGHSLHTVTLQPTDYLYESLYPTRKSTLEDTWAVDLIDSDLSTGAFNPEWYFITDLYICQIIDPSLRTAKIIRMKDIKGTVIIPNEINNYKIIGIGSLYAQDDDYEGGAEVIVKRCRKQITRIVIEEGIEWIGRDAFSGCISLKSVKLPNSLKIISHGAFMTCTSLTSITIPKNVSEIGSSFYGCTSLNRVTFKGNTILLGSTFDNCIALESITLPYGTTKIDNQFEDCTCLKKLVLPKSVKEIDPYRFDMKNLEELVITNKDCKLNKMPYSTSTGSLYSYKYLRECVNLTITAPKGSEIIALANEYGVKYKEVSLPKAPSITIIKTNQGENTVSWTKISGAAKYQIYYSKTKNGTYQRLTETTSTNYLTNKKGYIRIRGYRIYGGTKWYGSFKTIKIS